MSEEERAAGAESPADAWRRRRTTWTGASIEQGRLEEAIENGEVEPADVTFAAELVALADPDPEVRTALFVGTLAVAVARRRGSVRFDLEGGGPEGLARRLADELPTVFEDAEDAQPVAERLLSSARSDASSPLVGEADDYRPLVLESGHLYRHRDWIQEGRLADAVAGRVESAWRGDDWPESSPWGADTVREELSAIVESFTPKPTAEQRDAVVAAATAPLSVVTGGPGTGKTSLVVTLLRLLVALGVDPERIALAAPTGKAADRLGEAIDRQLAATPSDGASEPEQLELGGATGPSAGDPKGRDGTIQTGLVEPATIHRLLGYSERRRAFHHDEYRPLPYDYVIVDEASMIDLELMDRLVAAIEEEAKLVLVGDADQLPAVGSGAVFRDLVPDDFHTQTPRRQVVDAERPGSTSDAPLAAQSVELTKNFRMRADDPAGSNVLAVARAVRDGGERLQFSDSERREGTRPVVTHRATLADLEFRGAEILADPSSGWLDAWYEGRVAGEIFDAGDWNTTYRFGAGGPEPAASERLDRLFRAFRRYQLLGVTRRRLRGVDRIDEYLHERHVREQGLRRDAAFVVGEPVMMTRNDYERELFNGDRGIVLRVGDVDGGEVATRVVFPRREGYAAFALGPLAPHLDRAWSITVHKSQGSEYDSVAIALPTEPIPLATRELLYTGITRARRSVTFLGDPSVVVEAARRSDERNTGLVERL